MGREADFKHKKSLLILSSCEYRQDHNLIFLRDIFISKDVSQNSKSFLLGLILTNIGGKYRIPKNTFFSNQDRNLRRIKFYFQKKARYHRCCNLYLLKSIIWDIITSLFVIYIFLCIASKPGLTCLTLVRLFLWENLRKLGWVLRTWKMQRLNMLQHRQYYDNIRQYFDVVLFFSTPFGEYWRACGAKCFLILGLLREG